jgi:hypothetical protein
MIRPDPSPARLHWVPPLIPAPSDLMFGLPVNAPGPNRLDGAGSASVLRLSAIQLPAGVPAGA